MPDKFLKPKGLFNLGLALAHAGSAAFIGGVLAPIIGFAILGASVAGIGSLLVVVGYIWGLMTREM